MRTAKCSDSQIVAVLRETEAGLPVGDLLRTHGINQPAFYRWKQQYGAAGVPALQPLQALEQENAKRKRMYAEQAIALVAVKEVLTRTR